MRRGITRPVRSGWWVLPAALVAAWALSTAPIAHAQDPQPHVPDVRQRSGLLYRYSLTTPTLPDDRLRDNWYHTRWSPPNDKHVNSPFDGGLYGRFWKQTCAQCNYPNFTGAPGDTKICANCAPKSQAFRWTRAALHPWKPVGQFYSGGCYVPLYDLDPLVPGPGPYPWPFYFNGNPGG